MSRNSSSLSFKDLGGDLKAAFGEWKKDNAPQFAAAIAFYTILSLAPLLVFAVAVAAITFQAEAARGEIVTSVEQYIGRGAAEMVQEMIANASTRKRGLAANIFGFALLAFAASRIFLQLKVALNQILDVPTSSEGGIGKIIRDRIFSILAVGGVGIFLMASIVVSAVLNRIGDVVPIPGGSPLWQSISHLISLALISVIFALIFRYLPDTDIPWRHVWEGALFTAALFTFGQIVISIYLARADPGSSFGAAGPVIVLVIWIYFNTVIFFFGAEFMEVRYRRDPAFARRERSSGRREADVVQRSGVVQPPAASSKSRQTRAGRTKTVGSATAGGCLGILVGITAAMFGLLIGSARLIGRLFHR